MVASGGVSGHSRTTRGVLEMSAGVHMDLPAVASQENKYPWSVDIFQSGMIEFQMLSIFPR